MLLSSLNLNSLLVFQRVFESKSMTLAAKKLAMTQPGVSQHITGLEKDLGILLFIRDRKTIIPTKSAVALYNTTKHLVVNLEKTLTDLTDDTGYLNAEVSIGVPQEFGNNVLMPKLAKLHQKYPQVKFNLIFGFASNMNALVQRGEIDFAFVDDFGSSKGVVYEKVYQEELVLCCSKKYLNSIDHIDTKAGFEALEYVSYVKEQTVLKQWFKSAMGYKDIELNCSMRTEDTQGVYAFIKQDMGVGIIPGHMFRQKVKTRELHQFVPKYKTVHNVISLAYLERRVDGPFMGFMHNYLKNCF